jgi:hypothetical protein
MTLGLWKMRDKGCVGWLHKASQSKDIFLFFVGWCVKMFTVSFCLCPIYFVLHGKLGQSVRINTLMFQCKVTCENDDNF